MVAAKPVDRIRRSVNERVANREFDRGSKIGLVTGAQATSFGNDVTDGCLQSGEREVATRSALERARQGKPRNLAVMGSLLDRGSTGIAEPNQFCGLVERFSRRVVERRAEARIATDASAH